MNKLTIVIKGANFAKLLEEFKKQNLAVFNIKRIDPCNLEISVNKKQKAKIIAILNEQCYTIVSQKNSQPKSFLKPLKNIAIIVGIIFGVLLNFFATFFVWNICLVGDKNLQTDINYVLSQNGIKRFTLKHNLSPNTIKQLLFNKVCDISLVSVWTKGTTLFVSYTTKTTLETNKSYGSNIIAKDDGMIASILTISGTPMVKVGDYVKKGQVLISKIAENNGQEVNASGQVFAYVWKSATVTFSPQTIVFARTGKTCKNQKVMFRNSVLSETKNISSFLKSETENCVKYLTNKVLPIKIMVATEYELEPIEITQNFDENKEKVIAQAKTLCWEQIAGDENILEEKTETNFVSNIYFVTHYIKIKEQISWN